MKNKNLSSFYDAYFNSFDRKIKIETINKELFYCLIIGFFYKNEIIYKWHVTLIETNTVIKQMHSQINCEKYILVSEIISIEFKQNYQLFK